jgi:hypothetical protein
MVDGYTLMSVSGTRTVNDNPITNTTQRLHHQHDSTVTSRHGQHRLGNANTGATRECHHQNDSTETSFHRQHRLSSAIASMTRSCHHQAKQHPHLLAQDEDPVLHVGRGRVRFNKDHCPLCVDQWRKSLLYSYIIIFSLPNTYVQIRSDVTLTRSSAVISHRGHCWLGNANTSMTQ